MNVYTSFIYSFVIIVLVINVRYENLIDLPGFVELVGKNKLKVRTSDWRGHHENVVTEEDVNRYIARYSTDITSTYRCLDATPDDICGDWRMMNELVSILKDIFKQLKGKSTRY